MFSDRRNVVILVIVIDVILTAIFLMLFFNKFYNNDTQSPQPSPKPLQPTTNTKQYNKPPDIFLDENKSYAVVLHTSEGDITIKLFHNKVPLAANNFAFLAKDGFYENVIFHRVIEDFMIQGGDPTGTGRGGPGYKFKDEPFTGEYKRGIVAYANSGPNTNGSQFFIMHKDYNLPKNYVIFGEVIEGMDVVDKIATAPVKTNASGERSTPITPVVIDSADLIEL